MADAKSRHVARLRRRLFETRAVDTDLYSGPIDQIVAAGLVPPELVVKHPRGFRAPIRGGEQVAFVPDGPGRLVVWVRRDEGVRAFLMKMGRFEAAVERILDPSSNRS